MCLFTKKLDKVNWCIHRSFCHGCFINIFRDVRSYHTRKSNDFSERWKLATLAKKWIVKSWLILKESWMPKNWCFWTVVLEKTLESPLDCKEILPVNPKGNQSWIFIGRTDAEAEAPIHWLSVAKSQLLGKDPDAGKDWRQEKGTTEDEMTGWHHWLDGDEFEQALWVGDGQGGLSCYSPWGCKE